MRGGKNRQLLILVDENDNPTGKYVDKGECHFGEGLHHRAFVVLLENNKGEVLLQLRRHVRWDKFWDVTAISHVLHLQDAFGKDRDETYVQAAKRSLKDEMGVREVVLTKVGAFNYFAKYHGHCENEYCAVMVGKYEGKISPNKKLMYDYRWMLKKDFYDDVKKNPKKYTPWAVLTTQILTNKK